MILERERDEISNRVHWYLTEYGRYPTVDELKALRGYVAFRRKLNRLGVAV